MVNHQEQDRTREALDTLKEFVGKRATHYDELHVNSRLEEPETNFSYALDSLREALREHGWVVEQELGMIKATEALETLKLA